MIKIIETLKTERSLMDGLRTSKVPAAIVAREGGEEQHKELPSVEYLEIKNSGFFCYMEQPGIFNEFLFSFFKRH